jgi:2-oxo-4-hydroxy-4-carboxy-5-ureidoimidazoline decarboxylase
MSADEVARFNALPLEVAREQLLACCTSPSWADGMASGRPYSSARDAVRQSCAIVARLSVPDLEAALAGYTRPGPGALPQAAPAAQVAPAAPGGVAAPGRAAVVAEDDVLARSRREYEQRFGHVYLAYVTGRSVTQQLTLLRSRLRNQYAAEWQVVRTELQKINEVRLHELLAGS